MPKKTTPGKKPADREQDPMAIRKSRVKAASTRSKIKRTGLRESYCHGTCQKVLPISHFIVKRTGKLKLKSKDAYKPRKNTPSTGWKPAKECNKCLLNKKKQSGQYEKYNASRKERYKNGAGSREALNKAQRRTRAILSDSYIKKLLRKMGYTNEQMEANPKLIRNKRKEIRKKRESAANKTSEMRMKNGFYRRNSSAKLKPGYLRRLIKKSKGYNGEPITKEMLKKKKEEVLYERATGAKVWVKRTPPEERKKQLKENSEKRISTLDDVYIRGRIKSSVHYKGEEITEEMIQAKRKEIIIIRKNKKEGIRAPHASKQLTDGYMRALISLRLKIPKDQITFKQIIEAREQLEEKRRLREL